MSVGKVISYTDGAIYGADEGSFKALIELALRVTGRAKPLAPIDTNRLRGSIMWIVGKTEGGFGEGGTPEPADRIRISTVDSNGKITGVVGTAVPYAVYQEFGTRLGGGNPFLRPAIIVVVNGVDTMKAVMDIMTNNMRNNLKRNAKRYTVG